MLIYSIKLEKSAKFIWISGIYIIYSVPPGSSINGVQVHWLGKVKFKHPTISGNDELLLKQNLDFYFLSLTFFYDLKDKSLKAPEKKDLERIDLW